MRTIENYAKGEVTETFLVFETQAEREEYFFRAKRDARIGHDQKLADLRRVYIAGLTDRENEESNYREYMSGVKNQYQTFLKDIGRLNELERSSLLEADLSRET